jgi:hypothetical protein
VATLVTPRGSGRQIGNSVFHNAYAFADFYYAVAIDIFEAAAASNLLRLVRVRIAHAHRDFGADCVAIGFLFLPISIETNFPGRQDFLAASDDHDCYSQQFRPLRRCSNRQLLRGG